MLHNVSLNASMRANLLSLQQTSKLQDITSNRLSTGLKVNSAIDNPSAYYTAQSLSDRASDLNALLDAMSQGIQTLKAVAETIDAAAGLLAQASSTALRALETSASLPEKSWFEEQVGPDGAVVETADELKAAVAAGKKTIVIYGKIVFSNDDNIELKQGQKLVGTEYFSTQNPNAAYRNADGTKFSELSFEMTTAKSGIVMQDGCLVSDLKINYTNSYSATVNAGAIYAEGDNIRAQISNVDISLTTSPANGWGKVGIYAHKGACLDVAGNINIRGNGRRAYGIYSYDAAQIHILSGAKVNIQTSGELSYGMQSLTRDAAITLQEGSEVTISTDGASSSALFNDGHGNFNIYGKLNILLNGKNSYAMINSGAGARIEIGSAADIYIENRTSQYSFYSSDSGALKIMQGAKISQKHNEKTTGIKADNDFSNSSSGAFNPASSPQFSATTPAPAPEWDVLFNSRFPDDTRKEAVIGSDGSDFNEIIAQYDALIRDGSYKGINLLLGNSLKVSFNEDGSSRAEICGVDTSARALGLSETAWITAADISRSLSEISSALSQLRDYSAQFGTYNNVLTTRQNFTEAMINILEEGADKLTLADMNQESANMLALQTRQMLAVNALSLASQASQSVLRLF